MFLPTTAIHHRKPIARSFILCESCLTKKTGLCCPVYNNVRLLSSSGNNLGEERVSSVSLKRARLYRRYGSDGCYVDSCHEVKLTIFLSYTVIKVTIYGCRTSGICYLLSEEWVCYPVILLCTRLRCRQFHPLTTGLNDRTKVLGETKIISNCLKTFHVQ